MRVVGLRNTSRNVAVGSLFADLQALLREREGERLQGAWRRELWDAQALGWLALPGNRALAKRLHLQAAPPAGR